MNATFHSLNEYVHMPQTWDESLANIVEIRNLIVTMAKSYLDGLLFLYKKENVQTLVSKEHIATIRKTDARLEKLQTFKPQTEVDKFGVNLKNVIVDGTEGKAEPNKLDAFDKNFRDYCMGIKHFISQSAALIMARVKRESLSPDVRLSMVNLIMALEKLPYVQQEFNQLFATKNVDFNDSEEYDTLLHLAAIWSHLFENSLHKSNSILYSQKEYIKRYRKKISDFFEAEVKTYHGLICFRVEEKVINILAEAENVDEICSCFFEDARRKFPELIGLTLESVLWSDYFSEVQIRLQFLGDIIPGGFRISSDSFKNFDSVNKFLQFRVPIDDGDKALSEDNKGVALKCFTDLHQLRLLTRHIAQVNDTINQADSNTINIEVYDKWSKDVEKCLVDSFSAMLCGLNRINNVSIGAIHARVSFENITDAITEIQSNSAQIIKLDDGNELEKIINKLGMGMESFMSSLPNDVFV